MTRWNKARDIAFVVIGLVLALWSALLLPSAGKTTGSQWAVTCMVIGGIMVLFGAAGLLRRPGARGDERTRKLNAYAASWSWFSAVAVTSILFLLERWGIITVSADQVLQAMLLTLLGTIILFSAYYRKRGDVE